MEEDKFLGNKVFITWSKPNVLFQCSKFLDVLEDPIDSPETSQNL